MFQINPNISFNVRSCGPFFLTFLIAVLLWCHPAISKSNKQTITAAATTQSRVAGLATVIMAQVYRRMGYELKVECFPGKRALYKSNHGQTDAELVRVKSIAKNHPNLIRVPEVIFKLHGMAFVWNHNLKIRRRQDLRGHRVGIVRGIQWATEITESFSPKNVSTAYDLFKLLSEHKIDIALEADITGQAAMKTFLSKNIVMIEKPLMELTYYHFVHKKNRHLVERLNSELEKMNRLGEINKIIRDQINESTLRAC